ncbi:MAG: hypothetical protein M1482_10160 [Chloroflexi bacterium]|nr:hypothetical protein [Chloroflexota bacterium]
MGGTYEWLGTSMREWTYITHEVPPLWIIPLWGLACVAMTNLSQISVAALSETVRRTVPRRAASAS